MTFTSSLSSMFTKFYNFFFRIDVQNEDISKLSMRISKSYDVN